MQVTQLSLAADFSRVSLIQAMDMLPRTSVYRLQIHPEDLPYYHEVVGTGGPFTPIISVDLCPALHNGAWALWAEGDCVWSPGA